MMPARVRGAEPVEHLAHERRARCGVEPPVPLDARRASGLAIEELHDHEAVAVGERAEIEHLEDVIVADAAGGLRLALEALHRVGVRRRRSRAAP